MTKKELIKSLELYSDNVLIYVTADHGQTSIKAAFIAVSKDEEHPVMDFDEELSWKDGAEVAKNSHVTAVNIISAG